MIFLDSRINLPVHGSPGPLSQIDQLDKPEHGDPIFGYVLLALAERLCDIR
jgi:hypothetical protein